MTTIAYLHDGTSIYDKLFLEHLTKSNVVYFVTFNKKPRFVAKNATVVMHEPLCLLPDKDWAEGFRMYIFFLLRALLIRLNIRSVRPQLFIGCMATKYGFYSTIAGLKPTVVIVWGSDVVIAPKRFFLFRLMASYALRKADAVILDSQIQENAAIQLGCDRDKILRFPWFDFQKIHPKISGDEARERLGWRDNLIIFSARNHEPVYGVEHLIEAMPEIVRNEPKSRFLILGRGRLTENLVERTKELGVDKYVKFIGMVPREEVITYLNAADIYVSTSLSDGSSASLLEAMTLAVPPVVTEIPGNKEWIENDWSGYLVPVKDPASLAERITHLLKHKETRRKLGQNARKTIEEKVDWPESMQVFDNLIQKLTKRKDQ